MKLESVQVSKPQVIRYHGEDVATSIYKLPIEGRVMLHEHNLEGDEQADLKVHGGTYKAVYCYPAEHYVYWSQTLGRDDLNYGGFGENFTVSGMLEADVCVGDIYRVGESMVQVTQARIPCFKLAHKMGISTFVKDFLTANKSGFYLRVLETGKVGAGDAITLETRDPVGMSVAELNYLLHFDTGNIDKIKRALTIEGLSPSWYRSFEKLIPSVL